MPLATWARRFDVGGAELCARIDGVPSRAAVRFTGGRGARLDEVVVDGEHVPTAALDAWLEACEDLSLHASAIASSDATLRFAESVQLSIPRAARVQVRVQTRGPLAAPVLAAPLVLSSADTWLTVPARGLGWLGQLADVRITRAELFPDGRVALHGAARRGFDLAVRHGLGAASRQLSHLVRTSPRFERVRPFLAT